ncbi:hypothetical protein AAFF_G00188750 [Aldrovandia affinis]|uniref:Period circadian protein homolog 2 n=1 Tax=Aldrovandia affinis TaxID=143900 RepID=A0AAD7SYB9_9TELE|nr:hypothetical protein AAFF_G00188750 [Aldrovandia affinis]
MSEDPDSKRCLFPALEEQDVFGEEMASCSSMSQLHRLSGFGEARELGGAELGLASEGSDSGQELPASPRGDRKMARSLHEDVEMNGSGTESQGNESHGDDSNGNESPGSSDGNGKDSALLESSGSNKSSNSHSPSPPGSSNAFSLLSGSSEQDNPSSSGCSSEESAKAKTQKELIKTLKELKLRLPSEKRSKSKSNTLNALKYALRCVKQVKANEEYYQMLMINDSQPPGLDVSSYTIGEIDGITSEYTLKSTDIFAVAVSLITGKIVYISDQAASILNCKRDVFKNAKFVEFLSPQDVSVFYSFTTPYRLPSWSMCTGAESSPSDCMQEKSFFCRISGGRERKGDLQYYPFRMTPYLMKVQDTELTEDQFCCLLLAERVHSGYEAPRIPTDKRIFTTTHTPNCVFQDVDERAVPLLGFLPQDLIGTPVLLHLHPSDRPLMLAVHKKILQYVGQPFDHSSIRFRARNGEYVTIDTSWSSFVNPWSRKVSFVIGRHKVRMSPVNEDVFAAPAFTEGKIMDSDVLEITEQIHKLLLQNSIGSSGYGSLGSNGSHEQLMSIASSSESNSNSNEETHKAKPRTFQEICKDVHMLKNQEQQVFMASASKPEPRKTSDRREAVGSVEQGATVQEELAYKGQSVYSYQQISCLDSVIRYLEGCNIPITVKRKCLSSSITTSSNSDEDKQKEEPLLSETPPALPPMEALKKPAGTAVVGTSLAPLALPSKADSVVSITSQCSYSSTIVHVGDKKPQPESEIIEDVAESPAPSALPPSIVSPPSQGKEAYKKMGLTKQVLAAHTQKEEQAFLSRCREQRDAQAFQADCSMYLGLGPPAVARPSLSHTGTMLPQGQPGQPGSPLPEQAPVLPRCKLVAFPNQAPCCPTQTTFYPEQASFPTPFTYSLPADPLKASGLSRSSTPLSAPREQDSPPLFESRCSSPLQLNLLQLEETHSSAPPAGAHRSSAWENGSTGGSGKPNKEQLQQVISPDEGPHSDAHSSSSDLLDILLQEEDSRSGTGSASSGSLGSGSNGCSTSASGVGSSQTSNTSKYFGSVDSSENNHKAHAEAKAQKGEHFEYVLQEPVWLLMANADESVMMTYQLPSRDVQEVLKEDRDRLQQMRKSQPCFSEEQRRELAEVHPWMKRGGLPTIISRKECLCCKEDSATMMEEDPPDMELGAPGNASEDAASRKGSDELLQAGASPGPGPAL